MTKRLLLLATVSVACTIPAPEGMGATGPSYDVWEARVPVSAARAFTATLHTLVDSGFVPSRADSAQRIIATHSSRRNVAGAEQDYRFDAAIIPIGTDSARVQLRGEWCHVVDGAKQCYARTAWHDDWVLVRSLGEAIKERL